MLFRSDEIQVVEETDSGDEEASDSQDEMAESDTESEETSSDPGTDEEWLNDPLCDPRNHPLYHPDMSFPDYYSYTRSMSLVERHWARMTPVMYDRCWYQVYGETQHPSGPIPWHLISTIRHQFSFGDIAHFVCAHYARHPQIRPPMQTERYRAAVVLQRGVTELERQHELDMVEIFGTRINLRLFNITRKD